MSPANPPSAGRGISGQNDCWNHIGVFGDRTCEQLQASVHCRNCPVYAAAGRSLLEQPPPADYLAEWTGVLAESKRRSDDSLLSADGSAVRNEQSLSLMIVRLGSELFALPVGLLVEVSPPFPVHSVPHRTNAVFLGLVNIRGEIMLAASLASLLGVGPETAAAAGPHASRRMAVASAGDGRWVFPIDEILGVHVFHRDAVLPPPAVGSQGRSGCSQGVLRWQQRTVALLDADALVAGLNAAIAPP
ncbi:MAG: chemotaxis protein CheW [Cyanobacteriota bacterium]|nr:chemotaxis protein CheW [Cyanobacteriota bacterium]